MNWKFFRLVFSLLVVMAILPKTGLIPNVSAEKLGAIPNGTITSSSFHSDTLAEDIHYNIYLPAGYTSSGMHYPVIYLLHGRGDSMTAWTTMKSTWDAKIANGELPAFIGVMPDSPWSDRGNYYVDSAYSGSSSVPAGSLVETALTSDLIDEIDSTYRTIDSRDGRCIAGYSMGGYGALRYASANPNLFGSAIVLSPAVYIPLPPIDSSTREFGAFGNGTALFDENIYTALNYPVVFPTLAATHLPLSMFIAVGDDEWQSPEYQHDLDFEAHLLYKSAQGVDNIDAELRIVDGGHEWGVWSPMFVEGAKFVFRSMETASTSVFLPLIFNGTAEIIETPKVLNDMIASLGEDVAGGVATDLQGNIYQVAAVESSVDGLPYNGLKDIVLAKYSPSRDLLWQVEFGTSETEKAYGVATAADGSIYITGYTKGNLDNNHAGNSGDDVFLVKYTPSGEQSWVKQFGDAAQADRGYGVAVDASGNIFVGGYTKGSLSGTTNQGDKDIFLAKFQADGTQEWLKQSGGSGEEKVQAVAVDTDGYAYIAGQTNSALGISAGGYDGFVARYSSDGTQTWLTQLGTTESDELYGLTVNVNGIFATGLTAGNFNGTLAGDKDILTVRLNNSGAVLWSSQVGTEANDKGAKVASDADGNVYVAGFTDGNLTSAPGKFDAILIKYAPNGSQSWIKQFGSSEDDGADAWAEGNIYLATYADSIYVSGLTLGNMAGYVQMGSGDVFITEFKDNGMGGPTNPRENLAGMTGTSGEEFSGGVAVDLAGNIYQTLAVESSVDSQTHFGGKDVLLVKYSRNGQKLWTVDFGTSGTDRPYAITTSTDGFIYITGYTTANIDGNHPDNSGNDVFLAKYTAAGEQVWLKQFGDAAQADRGYGVAVDTLGNIFVGGYTKGLLDGSANLGDKDIFIAKYLADGTQSWIKQTGTSGEEKIQSVAVDSSGNVYIGGQTSGALGTAMGGYDGFVARYSTDGTQDWMVQLGTTENDEIYGLAINDSGIFVTGLTAGDFDGTLAGDKDILVGQLDTNGVLVWSDQVGTTLNDKGAKATLDADGNLYIAGFTEGNLGGSSYGKFDTVVIKYNAAHTRQWIKQLGSAEDDGADEWAEGNLYIAVYDGSVFLSGFTMGNFADLSQAGAGDVFLKELPAN
jgi:uncharacterized delta-60 repeat protein